MVAVIGDGVAALRVAAGLAGAEATVAVLAPDPHLGSMLDGRAAGLVTPGLAEHPHRLAASIGDDGARDIFAWTAAAAPGLGAQLLRRPVLRVSAGEGEDADIPADLEVLARLGSPVRPLSTADCARRLGTPRFGAGHIHEHADSGVVLPGPALSALHRVATDAGARVHTGCPALALHDEPDGIRVDTPRGPVLADVVVLAGDWRMRDLDPWCADKVGPVRHHFARYAPPSGGAPAPVVVSAQHGWLQARIDTDGALIVSGARWASPHFEVGETELDVQPDVLGALDRLVAQRFPAWHAAGRTHAWAGIAAHTCDQLPIVGPLPGRSSVVACFGWNGRPWSMAVRAADAVLDGLLTPAARPVTPWLRARRFV